MTRPRSQTLQQLELITTLVQTGSLTHTAQALGVSVPAVSQALDKLREQLGDPLMIRDGRSMTPTATAARIADDAAPHLEALADLHRTLMARSQSDTLDIAVSPAYEALVLEALIECNRRPENLTLHCAELGTNDFVRDTGRVTDLIAKRQLDMALVFYPVEDPRFHCIKVLEDHIQVIHRTGHPRIDTMTEADYYAEEHVVWKLAVFRQAWQELVGVEVDDRRIAAVIRDSLAMGAIVSKSDLIASAPDSLCRRMARSLPVDMKPFPFPHKPICTYLLYHKAYSRPELAQWVKDGVMGLGRSDQE
ncbi:LysR family transcriptional regulator [Ferrimonas balearica]|uniref:LysR family transcriptional regulator n=1 Tax=Ferrimonas balearica TaxID=44012 RepID=UPI001C97A403|nr:LysR family transcriptional regulator [Ferrimonas balearica]MBY5980787.1 LysR family transcriptional regulator [Ferrimonas balearica]